MLPITIVFRIEIVFWMMFVIVFCRLRCLLIFCYCFRTFPLRPGFLFVFVMVFVLFCLCPSHLTRVFSLPISVTSKCLAATQIPSLSWVSIQFPDPSKIRPYLSFSLPSLNVAAWDESPEVDGCTEYCHVANECLLFCYV